MALDKQKILNELGSVMNQLKSTDCGCLGKLFGDSEQNVAPTQNIPTCGSYRHACCHGHGYEPISFSGTSNNAQSMHRPCMGQCNPPKLYADTYNYLTDNLMQPTINEVYNDLKTITPENTIMNNPMANQLGLSKEQLASQYSGGSMAAHFHLGDKNRDLNAGVNYSGVNNMPNQTIPTTNLNSNQFGGMGPEIMNMFGESTTSKQSNLGKQGLIGQQPFSKVINAQEYSNNTIDGTPLSYNNDVVSRKQAYHLNESTNMNANSQLQYQNAHKYHLHGQREQGTAKFNEMFPGVMNNGDLGFDPMSIAMQMNPANQKQVAMDTIHKIMNCSNLLPNANDNSSSAHHSTSVSTNKNNDIQLNQIKERIAPKTDELQQQIIPNQLLTNQPTTNMYGASYIQPNQQSYPALISTPLTDHQHFLQNQQQQLINNNTSSDPHLTLPILNNVKEIKTQEIPKTVPQVQNAVMIKEPILPADKSRFMMKMPKQKHYEYNTLGQPVEMLPAKMYHIPEPALPQTLSPQTLKSKNDFMKYNNVKSSVSKTSLMDLKPFGKSPSRNQLQQIYNNYKGSHSYTQQNVSPTRKDGSYSERQLNMPQENFVDQEVERIGGDTLANNQENNERTRKVEHTIGQIGDAPVAYKRPPDDIPEKISPVVNRKYRNGLQDIIYTSYPSSAAWSFHGDGKVPLPAGRFRNKI